MVLYASIIVIFYVFTFYIQEAKCCFSKVFISIQIIIKILYLNLSLTYINFLLIVVWVCGLLYLQTLYYFLLFCD